MTQTTPQASSAATSAAAPADRPGYQDVDIEAPSKPVFGLLRAGYVIHTGTGRGARLIHGPARIPLSDKRMARDYLHMLDNRVEVQIAFGLPVDKEMATVAEEAEREKITRAVERRKLMGLDSRIPSGAGAVAGFSPEVMEAIVAVKVEQAISGLKKDLNDRIDGLTNLINEALTKS